MEIEKGKYWKQSLSPYIGCRKISPGCDNCWALPMVARFKHWPNATIRDALGRPEWSQGVTYNETWFNGPEKRRIPTVYALSWLSDLFYSKVHAVGLGFVCGKITNLDRHTFLVLTKRAERMAGVMGRISDPPSNVYLGVTICNQEEADIKMPYLYDLKQQGWKTWVSIEPMLGPINMDTFFHGFGTDFLDQVIVGGENAYKNKARPMNPNWVRAVRDDCLCANVPFFFKGWGKWEPCTWDGMGKCPDCGLEHAASLPGNDQPDPLVLAAKHSRVLDGKEHNDLIWSKK